ncbi:hypothetical protein B0T22DRAFT_140101 [Podospora appendiculata]|uniref:Uncharacterized protein n=1 Tax=Podospora appendiculata TaxID=314037 RepID=A0AAE0X855_9PEZI|nr:hypothetical protein B0T22DRAFT_140101 [Podospora appendiculata]
MATQQPSTESSFGPGPLPSSSGPSYGSTAATSGPSYGPLPSSSAPTYEPAPQGNGVDPSYSSYRPSNTDSGYKPVKPIDGTTETSYRPPPSGNGVDPSYSYRPSTEPSYEPAKPIDSTADGTSYRPPPAGNGVDSSYSYRPPPNATDPSYKATKAVETITNSSYRPLAPSNGIDSSYSYRPTTEPSYNPAKPIEITTGASYRPQPPAVVSSGLSYPPLTDGSAPSYFPQQMAPSVTERISGPAAMSNSFPLATSSKHGLRDSKATTVFALREYMSMQRRRRMKEEVGIEERLRIQASTVLGDLRELREDVAALVKDAESHRWRRFLLGGAIASFIPIVKALFQRPKHEKESSNSTEYAFKKSKSLISRVLEATRRPGIATVAFFVFAVLYVFQNEVALRAARSVSKRLKKLTAKVERGDEDINEDDLKLLEGWRWRVLQWSE